MTTPGIDAESGEYSEFGIPATILAHYLRENGIVPEKCDLNSILFLLTPAESAEKMAQLVAMLGQFEQHIEADTPLADVLPTIYNKYPVRYRDYTLRELCQEMHDLYVSFDVKSLQKEMFRKQSFPRVVDESPGCQPRIYPRRRGAGASERGGGPRRGGRGAAVSAGGIMRGAR